MSKKATKQSRMTARRKARQRARAKAVKLRQSKAWPPLKYHGLPPPDTGMLLAASATLLVCGGRKRNG